MARRHGNRKNKSWKSNLGNSAPSVDLRKQRQLLEENHSEEKKRKNRTRWIDTYTRKNVNRKHISVWKLNLTRSNPIYARSEICSNPNWIYVEHGIKAKKPPRALHCLYWNATMTISRKSMVCMLLSAYLHYFDSMPFARATLTSGIHNGASN